MVIGQGCEAEPSDIGDSPTITWWPGVEIYFIYCYIKLFKCLFDDNETRVEI
jgi:hypothetical protein